MSTRARVRSKTRDGDQQKPRAEVELAKAKDVTIERTSERILLDQITEQFGALFAGASKTILRAVSQFQSVIDEMKAEEPKGLAETIVAKVADAAFDDLKERLIDKIAEGLGPVNYVVKGIEIVADSKAEVAKAESEATENAVLQRVVSLVRASADHIESRGNEAVAKARHERPMDLLALNGSPLLSKPLLDETQVQDQIVVAYQKALRGAGLRTLEQQIQEHDYARFDEGFKKVHERDKKTAEGEKP